MVEDVPDEVPGHEEGSHTSCKAAGPTQQLERGAY